MKKSLQNCLKAVLKIEGTKLEDELFKDGCQIRCITKALAYYEIWYGFIYTKAVGVNHFYRGDTNIDGNFIRSEIDRFEILGNPNNFFQRVLGALNKKIMVTGMEGDWRSRDCMIEDIALGTTWNHSKDIQEDSTYDKITELLR